MSDLLTIEQRKALALAKARRKRAEAEPYTAPDEEIDAAGRAKSYALGVQRQLGRYGATARDAGQLATKAYKGQLGQEIEGQEDIAQTERDKEAKYKLQTREHPGFAFGGEATAMLPFAAGRTPAGAFTRGALGGALTYNEDPKARATQAVAGGLMNQFGLGIAGRGRPKSIQSRAKDTGMELLPEQRAPVMFPETVKAMDTYQRQAFGTATRNNKLINREALKTLGETGERFTDETFERVHKKAGDLFKEATKGSDKIYFGGGRFNSKIDTLLEKQEKKIVRDAKSVKALQRLQQRIEDQDGVLSTAEYQEIRSDITTSIRQTSGKRKALKRTLGEIVELLDNQAEINLAPNNPKALKQFKEARRLWRQYNLFKTEGIVDERTGNINPQRLRKYLRREDESGFLLNKDQGKLANMLRLDAKTPRGRERFDMLGNYADMRVVGNQDAGFRIGAGLQRLVEKPLIGAARIPQRLIEGAPMAVTVPAIKNNMSASEKVVNALISGSDEGLTPREKSELDKSREMVKQSLLRNQ